tara:strand:- start:2199 stop:2564 length:366 start_codon:yes stop_codon:yes gene_type:complete
MGCQVSKLKIHSLEEDVRECNKHIKYYDKQSLGSFNRELILCFGCKKCFELQSNQIKLNCGLCNNFFHCNIAGECMGDNCKFIINDKVIRQRYCNNCVIPNLKLKNNKCKCKECGKNKDFI